MVKIKHFNDLEIFTKKKKKKGGCSIASLVPSKLSCLQCLFQNHMCCLQGMRCATDMHLFPVVSYAEM